MATLSVDLLVARVEEMVAIRGFTKVKKEKASNYVLIHGEGQSQAGHPRPKAQVLILIDLAEEYVGKSIDDLMRVLVFTSKSRKLPPDSSIVFIFRYAENQTHMGTIYAAHDTYSVTYGPEPLAFYFETIHLNLFSIVWKEKRVTENWKIVGRDETIIGYTKDKKPIYPVRTPMYTIDAWPKLLGARYGDYLTYQQLSRLEVGPNYVYKLVGIAPKEDVHEVESHANGWDEYE